MEQVRTLWKYLLLYFYLPVFTILFMAFIFIQIKPSVKPEYLFRDITALADLPFYTGFVSHLGILLWAASVTSCLLAFFITRKLNSAPPQSRQFLLHAGLFSAFLMFDDLFLFHEEFASEYLFLGQKQVYLGYFLVGLVFLYFNRYEILSSDYLILVVALAALGISMVLDVVADNFYEVIEGHLYETYEAFFEDGLKFIGIATWLAFYLRYINSIFIPVSEQIKKERGS